MNQAKDPSSAGLAAWYPLDGDARDASGHGHDGVLHGATPTPDRFGRPKGALAFDGADDEVLIDPPPALSDKVFTVSVWVNFDNPDEHNRWTDIGDGGIKLRDPIVGLDDGYSIRCFQLWVLDEKDGGILWHRMCEFSSCWTKWKPQAKRWYQVAATFDGKTHRLFVDGKLEMQADGIFAACQCQPIQIGSKGKRGTKRAFFAGRIDDLRLYNRALSAEEIAALFRAGG